MINRVGRENDQNAPATAESRPFYLSLFLITAVSLWPLWSTRFLAMQDYPQHLFLAEVIATFDDPAFNWREFYRVDLGFGPYMLWYVAMKLLGGVFGSETAGKLLFSLYILLISLLALAARRLAPKGELPWGALLLFPCAFSQVYFLGFPNYIISLPLIFLALLDLDALSEGITVPRLARHGLYLVLLFLIHPYSLLVYIALSLTSGWVLREQRGELLRTILPALVMSLVFMAWYVAQHGPAAAPTAVPWSVRWLPPHASLAFYLLQFTGMRFFNGPDWPSVGAWGAVAAICYLAWKHGDGKEQAARRFAAWYGASLAGMGILPFWLGYYSYFNLRLAPVSYFALALMLCCVRIRLRQGVLLALCTLALQFQSIRLQKEIVLDTQTIVPIVSAARKNALVLPLVYQADSNSLDPYFFNEIHSHDADYLQLLVGGGANPTLFPNAMMPVQYRSRLMLPFPRTVAWFSWSEHGAYYDYVLVREAPPEIYARLSETCDLVAKSGPWGLFKNKTARRPL